MLLEAARPTVTQPSSGKTTPAGTMGLSSTTSRGLMIPEKSSASPAIVRSEARSSRRVGSGGGAGWVAHVAHGHAHDLPDEQVQQHEDADLEDEQDDVDHWPLQHQARPPAATAAFSSGPASREPLEDQLRGAQLDTVAVLKHGLLDVAAVEPCAVGRPEIAQHEAVTLAADLGVLARDVGVGEHDAATAAASEHGDFLAQLPLTLRAAQRGARRAASRRRRGSCLLYTSDAADEE